MHHQTPRALYLSSNKCLPFGPAALISSVGNSRVHTQKWVYNLGMSLLCVYFQGTYDETAAEGDLVPCLLQILCPDVWPHTHYDVHAAGVRMIEGPLSGTWVPGSAGSDLAGNLPHWQPTLCQGGKFPSVKMPWGVCMCVCLYVCVWRVLEGKLGIWLLCSCCNVYQLVQVFFTL